MGSIPITVRGTEDADGSLQIGAGQHPVKLFCQIISMQDETYSWFCSSIGRAPPCHGGGRGFETLQGRQIYGK